MTSGAAPTSDPLSAALRQYLERNPDAADSLDGIRRWWLPQSLQSVGNERLQVALDGLVASGEMQVRCLPDGAEFYARAGPA
jgi:hypothetical protein